MSVKYPDFEQFYKENNSDIYKFTFLLVMDKKGATDTAFQTFLNMGAQKQASDDPQKEKVQLFSYAYLSCEDYFLRRLRHKSKRELLQQSVYFPISDSLWMFLKYPFKKKAAAFLCSCCNFTADESACIMRTSKRNIENLCVPIPCDAVSDIFMSADDTKLLEYNILQRFQERSVSVENKLISIRSFMDRAVLWIAVIIIILCAAAVFYTSHMTP